MRISRLIFLFILLTGCSKEWIRYHGIKYNLIRAGEQVWMAENLASASFRTGRKIPVVKDYGIWPELETPACGYYKNDTSMLRKYGMLYNWYVVGGGKLCPFGWHVPSNDDWLKLEEFLGGHLRAAGRMKAVSGWSGKHVSGDDIGFKALPGGYRLNEDFQEGESGKWWSSSVAVEVDFRNEIIDSYYKDLVSDYEFVWGRSIDSGTELQSTLNRRNNGFSVRCIKNR